MNGNNNNVTYYDENASQALEEVNKQPQIGIVGDGSHRFTTLAAATNPAIEQECPDAEPLASEQAVDVVRRGTDNENAQKVWDAVDGGMSNGEAAAIASDLIQKNLSNVDFAGKDFEDTQKMLNMSAKMSSLNKELNNVKMQRDNLVAQSFKSGTIVNVADENMEPGDVIQYHLDKVKSVEELHKMLNGKVTDKAVADRINSFFINPKTGEKLELASGGPQVKTESEELDFRRAMLMYFKQNDEYMEKIDKEVQKLNEATEELNANISELLNPLKDNVYAYAVYLDEQNQPSEGDNEVVAKVKAANRTKAKAIRSAYTLENMIELVESKPSIIDNSLRDFRNETRLKEIGKRYSSKLRTAKIEFDLIPLLTNDTRDSLEYKVLPQGDYPAGLEGFTIFFIIRSLGMSLPNKEDEVFHAAIQVAWKQLLDGSMDEDIAAIIKKSLTKFLSYFNK